MIRKAIFDVRPTFGTFYATWGDRTWVEYYSQPFENVHVPSERIEYAIRDEVAAVFGNTAYGMSAARAIAHKKWVSTADHHGLLCHPYFYASNIAQSDVGVRDGESALVTLSFGNISLGNDSFPRGFFFHDTRGAVIRVPFKHARERALPVCVASPMSKEEFNHVESKLEHVELDPVVRVRLHHFFTVVRNEGCVWSQKTYGAQLTIMNQLLWRELFQGARGDLFYVEIDAIVRRLLLETHLAQDTPIRRILLNPLWRSAYVRLFEGVQGAHHDKAGTQLFWYVDYVRGIRRGLFVVGDTLKTIEGDITIACTEASLSDALRARIIIPGTALLLLVVHGVESLTCAGGVSQLEYLPVMLHRWNELLAQFSFPTPTLTNTSIVAGEHTLFSIVGTNREEQLASLFDLYLYEHDPQSRAQAALETTPIRDTIDAMVPTLHKLLLGAHVSAHLPFHLPRIVTNHS